MTLSGCSVIKFFAWHAGIPHQFLLIQTLTHEDLRKTGVSRSHPVTVLAAACIILGHVEHHMRILRERYL
ncbi:hypothetical protein AAC03nite_12950 [Alicyclobacillus acidoterrestris]|nr:hypothetical protein AAC03nite_12950 [Alicyclobacillus acidoterrestris]